MQIAQIPAETPFLLAIAIIVIRISKMVEKEQPVCTYDRNNNDHEAPLSYQYGLLSIMGDSVDL